MITGKKMTAPWGETMYLIYEVMYNNNGIDEVWEQFESKAKAIAEAKKLNKRGVRVDAVGYEDQDCETCVVNCTIVWD